MSRVEHIPGEKRIAYPPDPLDSFSRTRVAPPFRVFAAQFNYDILPALFEQSVVNGSVTHIPASSAIRLSTGDGAAGNKAILQTKRYFRYQPGKAHNVLWTCVLGNPSDGVLKMAGLYDAEDGLAFVQGESGIGVLRRTSTSGAPVDVIVPQAEWNLDKLDGTGPSDLNLDFSKNNIFVIDMQWLGAGRIRFGFDFSGHITYCHEVQWANTSPLPYMRTANLPFRVEVENVGVAGGAETIDLTCVSISSGGGSEPFGLARSTSNAVASLGNAQLRPVSQSTEPLPLLSIRPSLMVNGLVNRGQVKPVSCQLASQGAPVSYAVVLNGVLADEAFASVSGSIVDVDIDATSIVGGTVIASGYLGGSPGMQIMETTMILLDSILSNNIVGDSSDILTVVVRRAAGNNSDCGASLTWREVI